MAADRTQPVIRLVIFRRGLLVFAAISLLALACAASVGARGLHGTRKAPRIDPSGFSDYCQGCDPPLRYYGGPVMSTGGARGVTITPVYWAPANPKDQFPAGYESLINGYIANVAAASGQGSNVYSIDTEYYDIFGGQLDNLRYHITAGTPIVDTEPFPRNGCRITVSSFDRCIADGQLTHELQRVLAARHLPMGLANLYPVFFPPDVEGNDGGGNGSSDNSSTGYCGYHANIDVGKSQIVYTNEPYESTGCFSGQSPNDDVGADTAIDTLSHEINESITDPEASYGTSAWEDGRANYEVADMCETTYGFALGSTDPSQAQSTEYNQLINNGHYYTQTSFSNYAYRHFGVGKGCQPSEQAARGPAAVRQSQVAQILFDPYPNTLAANGRATSSVYASVGDKNGDAIAGDRVYVTTYVRSGSGQCGKVSPVAAKTGQYGDVTVTYRASRSNVECVIVATDALGGRSASAIVYQGTTQARAATAAQQFPKAIRAGRTAMFASSFTNPDKPAIRDAQVVLAIFPVNSRSANVPARAVSLSVSTHGRHGRFDRVSLSGSTGQGEIRGVIGGAAGFTFPGRHKLTLTYRMKVKTPHRGPLLALEAYLYQVNPATGDGDVLADTLGYNVTVR